MKVQFVIISAIASLLAATTEAQSASCPKLSGTYRCPKTETQDELKFSLTQKLESDGTTNYTFKYEGFPESSMRASPTGVINEQGPNKFWVYCMNRQLLSFMFDSADGWVQQSFLSPRRDYVIQVKGKEFLRCKRVK